MTDIGLFWARTEGGVRVCGNLLGIFSDFSKRNVGLLLCGIGRETNGIDTSIHGEGVVNVVRRPPQTNRGPLSHVRPSVCALLPSSCPIKKARLGVEFLWGLVSRDWAGVLLDCLRCVWGVWRDASPPLEKMLATPRR